MFDWLFGNEKKKIPQDLHNESFIMNELERLLNYFQDVTGMDFSHKKDVLMGKLTLFCHHNDIYSFDELLKLCKKNNDIEHKLIDYLTINETYFNREYPQIKALSSMIKESPTKVDILSLPCSSGEEVYTILIELLEAGISSEQVSLTGFDINSTIIEKARSGLFSERSLHRVEQNIITKYFQKEEQNYKINDRLKYIPHFSVQSIFALTHEKKYDYIFCRNLLIYFDEETKKKAIRSLMSLLKEDGKLFLGHSDHVDETLGLETVYAYGTKFYK